MTTGYIFEAFPGADKWGLGLGRQRMKRWAGGDRSGLDNSTNYDHAYQLDAHEINAVKVQYRFRGSSEPFQENSSQLFGNPYGTLNANVKNSNINRMHGDIKGHDFNAAVSMAETNKNVKMIGDAAVKLAKAYKAASHGDLVKAAQVLTGNGRTPDNKVAKNWLELQYGWLPLLKDAREAATYIKTRSSVIKLGSHRTKKKLVEAATSGPSASYKICESETRHQLILRSYMFVNEFDGLGFTDPASVLWELMPYSFVIDWFLPIGNFLEAANASRVTTGVMVETTSHLIRASHLQSSTFYEITGGEAASYKSIFMHRAIGSMPTPSLPTFNPINRAASLGHTMNGIALLNNLHR